MTRPRLLANYRFVDYVTQLYLLGVGLLIAAFHNERTPQWALLLGIHAAGLVVVHGLVVGHGRWPGSRVLRVARHFYPMAMFVVLYWGACVLDLMFVWRYQDRFFIRLEEAVFWCRPYVVFMDRLPYLLASEVFYAAYASFYPMVLVPAIALYVRKRSEFSRYVGLVSFVFYACFLVFIVLPVAGPPIYWNAGPEFLAVHRLPALRLDFPEAIQGGPFFRLMGFIYDRFEAQGGAFPSSHVAVAVCTLWFTWRCFPRLRFAHLGLVVLLCLATAAHARNHAQAASLAQSKMAELVATEQYHDAQMEGDFGEDLPDYTWTAEVNDWEDERLAQLDVSVRWTRRGREHQVVLSSLVYLGRTGE